MTKILNFIMIKSNSKLCIFEIFIKIFLYDEAMIYFYFVQFFMVVLFCWAIKFIIINQICTIINHIDCPNKKQYLIYYIYICTDSNCPSNYSRQLKTIPGIF